MGLGYSDLRKFDEQTLVAFGDNNDNQDKTCPICLGRKHEKLTSIIFL